MSALEKKETPARPRPRFHRIRLEKTTTTRDPTPLRLLLTKRSGRPPLCPMLHRGGNNKQERSKKRNSRSNRLGVVYLTYCTGLLFSFPESLVEKAHPLPFQDKSI